MTFVYCNVACLLYTRGQSHKQGGALRKQSARNLDIPWMRERTDVAGIQIGIGIQRIPGAYTRARPNGLCFAQETLTRSQYIPCTDLRYRFAYDTNQVCIYIAVQRRCVYTRYISRLADRDKSKIYARRFLFHCRLQISDTLHPILQSRFLSCHLIRRA